MISRILRGNARAASRRSDGVVLCGASEGPTPQGPRGLVVDAPRIARGVGTGPVQLEGTACLGGLRTRRGRR